jgi:hypothetical protein
LSPLPVRPFPCLKYQHNGQKYVVKKAGKTIGLISIGEDLQATLLEREKQFEKLNAMVSWDYYGNWRWRRENKEVGWT